MRVELTGRHVDITPTLRRLVDAGLRKLDRLLNDSAVSAQIVLTREKNRLQVEITLHVRDEKFLHAVASSAAWGTSLSEAIEKIAQQARRVKGKWRDRKRHGLRTGAVEEAVGESPAPAAVRAPRARLRKPRLFQSSRQVVKPMSVADAVREVEARSDGDLVVFRDVERGSISVLYRRANGELTLVETEA
ncbi:MAG: ribosome-associated translation inhibitor RaiA [Acidobacteriota bacterium]